MFEVLVGFLLEGNFTAYSLSIKFSSKTLQKSSPLGSWSKIRYLLHINGRRSPFVR